MWQSAERIKTVLVPLLFLFIVGFLLLLVRFAATKKVNSLLLDQIELARSEKKTSRENNQLLLKLVIQTKKENQELLSRFALLEKDILELRSEKVNMLSFKDLSKINDPQAKYLKADNITVNVNDIQYVSTY